MAGTLAGWAQPETEAASTRRFGRIAGALFLVGAFAGTPTILFHDPPLDRAVWLLTLLAAGSGLICLRLPWERIDRRWLHLVTAIATLEVLLTMISVGPIFCWYYVLVAIYAAYVFPTRREIAAQLAFIGTVMFTPVILGLGRYQYPFLDMLVAVPTLLVAAVIVVSLREQLERGQEAYRQMSRSDPLTGAGNYRELLQVLVSEISRHTRSDRSFALILIDLDGFKAINDSLGHMYGDRILREVAAVLADSVRPGDTVARHGGDEFSVVAPETDGEEAAALAKRLEEAVSRVAAGETKLGASTGWALFPGDGTMPDRLLAVADADLMRDKRSRPAVGREPVERA